MNCMRFSFKENRMQFIGATGLHGKIRGSAVEGPAVLFPWNRLHYR
jgi:hypothetical protein